MLNRSGNTTDNLELHVSATFHKYGNMWFRPVFTLGNSNHGKPRPPIRDKSKQSIYYSPNHLIYFEAVKSLCFDENVYCDDKKTVNIVFPLFAVLCFSTPKSFKIPLQGLSELCIRSLRSTVVLQSSQFVPQKSRSRYCVLIATLSQITFSDIKKIYIYTWLSGDLIATRLSLE